MQKKILSMIPEDGENALGSMDMIGSFPDRKPNESNDGSVTKEQIENDVLLG